MAFDTVTFRSTIDLPMTLLLGVPLMILPVFLFVDPKLTHSPTSLAVALGAHVFAILSIVYMFRVTRYVFEPTRLRAQTGPLKWDVPYNLLRTVRPSRDVSSAPAFAFNRLKLEYGSGQILLVSPAQRALFLDEIRKRAPHVTIVQ